MASFKSEMLSLHSIKDIQAQRTSEQVKDIHQKVNDLNRQLARLEQEGSSGGIKEVVQKAGGDWTKAYDYFEKYADSEDLKERAEAEEKRLQAMAETQGFTGHCHTHGEERKLFELPEPEKMKFCERHRILGNYLYQEGLVPKAAEQYQLALSYYEYCFPETEEEQTYLDTVREAALCNISLCYTRLGYLREAVSVASQAIEYYPTNFKAYYRRAQAYRKLDEYDTALADAYKAAELCPHDAAITKEISTIQALIIQYEKKSQQFAATIIGGKKPLAHQTSLPSVDHSHLLAVLNPAIVSIYICDPSCNMPQPLEPSCGIPGT